MLVSVFGKFTFESTNIGLSCCVAYLLKQKCARRRMERKELYDSSDLKI